MNLLIPASVLASLTFSPLLSLAQTTQNPAIVVKISGSEALQQSVYAKNISMEVNYAGQYAETLITFTFYNDHTRNAEADFLFPIPKGAKISQLELDINGEMRNAVSVPKERAKLAYENTVRRNIDPALVEQVNDTTFRTRLFPIPPKGTKSITLGYIQKVDRQGNHLTHTIPFNYKSRCEQFDFKIGAKGTQFNQGIKVNGKKQLAYSVDNPAFVEPISVTLKTHQSNYFSSKDGFYHVFSLQSEVDPAWFKAPSRPLPKTLHLVWDTSSAMYGRDKSKQYKLLDSYFSHVKEVSITLTGLGQKLVNKGEFKIKNGNWESLRKAIDGLEYEGSMQASINKIATNGFDSVIMVAAASPVKNNYITSFNTPFFLVTDFETPSGDQFIMKMAAKGARSIHLPSLKKPLRVLTHNIPRFSSSKANIDFNDKSYLYLHEASRLNISGKIFNRTDKIKFQLGTHTLEFLQQQTETPMALKIWARDALNTLSHNKHLMVEHAVKHGLATEHTSLIVLDRIQDYITYRILPPTAELRSKYHASIQSLAKKNSDSRLKAHIKIATWDTSRYFWIDGQLADLFLSQQRWNKAQEIAFTKQQRETFISPKKDNWFKKTEQILRNPPSKKTKVSTVAWEKSINLQIKQFEALQPSKTHRDKQPVVSIRGQVKKPQTYQFSKPITLEKAILKAIPIREYAKFSNVDLYRNGMKTSYNLLSNKYLPVALQSGDMIVLRNAYFSSGDWDGFSGESSDDPFGESDSTPDTDPADQPAINSESEASQNLEQRILNNKTKAPTVLKNTIATNYKTFDYSQLSLKTIKSAAFAKKYNLKPNLSLDNIYKALRQQLHNNPEFYFAFSRIWSEAQQPNKAELCLYSLLASEQDNPTNLRRLAHESHRLQLADITKQCHDRLLSQYPNDTSLKLEQAIMLKHQAKSPTSTKGKVAIEKLSNLLNSYNNDSDISAYAETIYLELLDMKPSMPNQFIKESFDDGRYIAGEDSKIEADIRVTMSSSSPSKNVFLTVDTPTLLLGQLRQSYNNRILNPNTYGEFIINGASRKAFSYSSYLNKKAVPGNYQFKVSHDLHQLEKKYPFYVTVEVITDWNRKTEKRTAYQVLIDPSKSKSTLINTHKHTLK